MLTSNENVSKHKSTKNEEKYYEKVQTNYCKLTWRILASVSKKMHTGEILLHTIFQQKLEVK